MTRASTGASTRLRVTVRYFASARAARGSDAETLTVDAGTTVGELIDGLARRDEKLAAVLGRCSYLCDGMAVRDRSIRLRTGHIIDVLPPFAGG
jgi:molybdopterin converting factor small subunit